MHDKAPDELMILRIEYDAMYIAEFVVLYVCMSMLSRIIVYV